MNLLLTFPYFPISDMQNQEGDETAYNIAEFIPSRTFTDESKMLRDLELCPSATLVLKVHLTLLVESKIWLSAKMISTHSLFGFGCDMIENGHVVVSL